MVEGDVLGGDGVGAVEHSEQWTWAFGAVRDGRSWSDIPGLRGKNGAVQEPLAR
jgi:hypothetical protein